MKVSGKILLAFVLNLSFSVFEFIGGTIIGSVAIVSDSFHDICDSVSIGLSYFFEIKSQRQPDENYTYGYARFSLLGGLITTLFLLFGSVFIIVNSIRRIAEPTEINYNAMLIFAVIGVVVNLCAAFFTHGGISLNQKAVNLHMLEDVLGWIVVLIGAAVMRFTGFAIIDPIMSVFLALFVIIKSLINVRDTIVILLEKKPEDIDIEEIKVCIKETDGILNVHHIHIWTLDGQNNCATMHIIYDGKAADEIKKCIREKMKEYGIIHVTIETENESEKCTERNCRIDKEYNLAHSEKQCHHSH